MERQPGPLADEKREATPTPPGQPDVQPQAAEVESARLLANQSRDVLRSEGCSDDEIERLADQFVAEDRGESVAEFIAWARTHSPQPKV